MKAGKIVFSCYGISMSAPNNNKESQFLALVVCFRWKVAKASITFFSMYNLIYKENQNKVLLLLKFNYW